MCSPTPPRRGRGERSELDRIHLVENVLGDAAGGGRLETHEFLTTHNMLLIEDKGKEGRGRHPSTNSPPPPPKKTPPPPPPPQKKKGERPSDYVRGVCCSTREETGYYTLGFH